MQWQTGQRISEAKASLAAGKACETLPLTAKAWMQGEISASAARTIAKGVRAGHEDVYGKGSSDKNGLYVSHVGNRWAITGDLDELAGTTIDEAIRDDATALLATRPGDPALSPTDVRRLLCDAKISRIVYGPESIPLDSGRAVYTPSAALRRAVIARDQHSKAPGCHGKPRWCEVHHVIPFPKGETTLLNLVLLCDRHHDLLHRPGWNATFDGIALTITRPDGATM